MNESKRYILSADLVLTSPLHISSIEKGAYDPQAQRVIRFDSKTPGHIGCTLTRTMEILLPSMNEEGQPGVMTVPVIPATTLRGRLRRLASELIYASLVERGLKISDSMYNTMSSGTATASGLEKEGLTPAIFSFGKKDLFLGLFGGTSLMLGGDLCVGEGWPIIEQTSGMLMTAPVVDVPSVRNGHMLMEALPVIRRDSLADMKGRYLENVVGMEELMRYIESTSEEKEQSRKGKAEGAAGKKVDLRAFNATEAVRPGVNFALRLGVQAMTPAHLGFAILAMQALLRDGQIGGGMARGRGFFDVAPGSARLYTVDPTKNTHALETTLFGERMAGFPVETHPLLQEAVTAAQDYIDSYDPSLMEMVAKGQVAKLKERLAS